MFYKVNSIFDMAGNRLTCLAIIYLTLLYEVDLVVIILQIKKLCTNKIVIRN